MNSLSGPTNPYPVESSSHKVFDTNSLGQVKITLQRHFASELTGMPIGCNLVIMQEGKPPCLLTEGNIEQNATQHWGSVSKQFTAACVAQLVEKRLLSWDDDIRQLCPDLPEFKLDGVTQKVTVDDLLHMRSGLPEYWSLALISGKDGELLDNKEILALLNKHPALIYAPGSQEMYCNTNYSILAKIVEDVAKKNNLMKESQTFVDFVREQIFVPLGMQARCATDPESQVSIKGFDDESKDCTTQSPSYGAGGIVGAPTDMIKWNTVLSNKELDALTEPPKGVLVNPNQPIYCRGLISTAVSDYRRIHHGGNISGFVTIFRRYEHNDPSKTFAYFLTTNLDNVKKAEDAADEVANALAGKKIEEANSKEKSEALSFKNQENEARKYEGTFLCKEFDSPWEVQIKEDEKNVWGVHLSPIDNRSVHISFTPLRNETDGLVFQSTYAGQIQLSDEGFVYTGGKMAPVHFSRIH